VKLINRLNRPDMNSIEAYTAIKSEVMTSFEVEEILKFNTFEAFWDQIEENNGYEEEWEEWKKDGVIFVYLQIFNDIKGINPFDSAKTRIVNLLCLLNLNMNAYDDDLESTWREFVQGWSILKGEIESLIES